jgi:hypothetical protein
MASLTFEYLMGNRSDSKNVYLTDQKQLYKKNGNKATAIYYKCVQQTCKSAVKIDKLSGICQFTGNNHEHNHQDDASNVYAVQSLKQEIIHRSKTEHLPVRKIYDSTVRKEM